MNLSVFDTPKSARSLKPTYRLFVSIDIFITLQELQVNSTAITCTVITQVDRQIVDPDPGKNYDAALLAGDLHFEMEKYIYIAVVQIVARFQFVMLDDTVLLRKNLARFR